MVLLSELTLTKTFWAASASSLAARVETEPMQVMIVSVRLSNNVALMSGFNSDTKLLRLPRCCSKALLRFSPLLFLCDVVRLQTVSFDA